MNAAAKPTTPSRRSRLPLLRLLSVVALIGAGLWWFWPPSEQRLLDEAARFVKAKNFRAAETLALRVLEIRPDSASALLLAADAAEGDGRKEAALAYLERAIDGGAADEAALRARCGRLALEVGRLAAGERLLRRAIALAPGDARAGATLIYALRIQGRNWEARDLIRQQFARGTFAADELFLAGTTEWVWLDSRDGRFLEYCESAVPDDPLPKLARARQALLREEVAATLPALQQIARVHPDLWEAQARWGAGLLQLGDEKAFTGWLDGLPSRADAHPEIWFTRGLWLRQRGDDRTAIRCFGEALQRQPDHRGACAQLSQLLAERPDRAIAERFAERARRLARLEDLLREVQQTPAMTRELAELLEALGRPWEAYGWARVTLAKQPHEVWAKNLAERLKPTFSPDQPMTTLAMLPVDEAFWSEYPLPERGEQTLRSESPRDPARDDNRVWPAFTNVASTAGVSFRFDNGADPSAGRAFMFEFSGGGVAVLDYDLDEWPDLYLTQGGRWPARKGGRAELDRLFRHDGHGGLADVTEQAGLREDSFSQGATVGDYNSDGFADLYVANIGPNRFFRNNGDGTFTEATDETATAGNAWSLSAALADFNGDGLADLYVVNYLGGDVLQRACTNRGRPVQCAPASFPAEQDRLLLNQGDGRFEDVTASSGIERPDGKGMGLIVADLDGIGGLEVFVANDTTPNFLFLNRTTGAAGPPQFEEAGILAGVAFDERGQAQSSMGAAVGDANGDGLPDLFVTNYLREPNNLFLRSASLAGYRDQARAGRLHEPSLNLMGWGTQFLDADADGDLDLVVANGHLDDYSGDGVPYRMRTQLFVNDGAARFDEAPARSLGPHFEQPVLGRAVARLDWNRDGREDFCMTHVDAPFALLSNTTVSDGHSLTLSLRGVTSSREAIGTRIDIQSGSGHIARQLAAGDGFAAANERKLVIGLGAAERADRVVVRWPSGSEQTFTNLTAGREWRLVEERAAPLAISVP